MKLVNSQTSCGVAAGKREGDGQDMAACWVDCGRTMNADVDQKTEENGG